MTDEPRGKLGAVCAASLLVAAAIAGVVSVSGVAAATNAPVQTTANDLPTRAVYLGQELKVDVTGTDNDDFAVRNGETVFFYEITGTDTIELVATSTVDGGTVTVETGELDDPGQVAINNRSSYEDYQTEFGVLRQTFDVEWEQETVTPQDDAVALEVDSNRAPEYNVTISADGLDYEELNALFVYPGSNVTEVTDSSHLPLDRLGLDREDGDDVSDLRNRGYITLELSSSAQFAADEELVANFTNLDSVDRLPPDEEYTFDVFVTDTTARDNATVQTGERRASFDQSLYTRAAGDLAEFSVDLGTTEEAWVQLVDPESNFVDVLYLDDGDGDGDVSFVANTRLMGTDHSDLPGLAPGDTDAVYYAENDTVASYLHDEVVANDGGPVTAATFYEGTPQESAEIDFTEYVRTVRGDDPTEQLSRPLQPTDYRLTVADDGRFGVEDDDPMVDDRIGTADLDLVQPGVRDVNTSVAPAEDADAIRAVDGLEPLLTPRNEVAIGDRFVVQYEATGLVGALATIDYVQNGNDIDEGLDEGYSADVLHELAVAESDWVGEGIEFTFRGQDRPNREPDALALDSATDSNAYVLVDQQTAETNDGTVAVVVDAEDESFADGLADGERFDLGLTYRGNRSRFQFDDRGGPLGGASGNVSVPSYPYLPPDYSRNVAERTRITFQQPWARFANTEDGTVQLPPTENATVAGRTNLAPGTDAVVRVRVSPPDRDLPEEDPSFLARQQVEIQPDGSFSTAVDLSRRVVGEEGAVQFVVDDEPVDTYDVVFRDIDGVRAPFFEAAIDAPATVATNGTVNVTATVTNTGDEAGTGELTLRVDGETAVRGVFDLERGQSETLTHSVTAGEAPISLAAETGNTTATRTIEIATGTNRTTPTPTSTPPSDSGPPTPTPTPDEPTPASTPTDGGGGIATPLVGVSLAVLMGVGIVLFRRWNSV